MELHNVSNYDFTTSLDKEYGVDESRKVNPYFGSYKYSTVFLGGSGSGKTTSMIRFFDLGIYKSDMIIYIAPKETIDSRLVNGFIKKYKAIPVVLNKSTDFNGLFKEIVQLHNKTKHKTKIIILDDFGGFTKNRRFNDFLSELTSNASRLNANVIVLCQQLTNITPQIAGNFNVWCLFCRRVVDTQIKAVLKNRTNVRIPKHELDPLISTLSNPPKEYKYVPLVVNGEADPSRQLLYGNKAITFNTRENRDKHDKNNDFDAILPAINDTK